MRTAPLRIVSVIMAMAFARATSAAEVEIKVESGKYDRLATPVSLPLPSALRKSKLLIMTRMSDDENVPVQLVSGNPPRVMWIENKFPAGQTRHYRLRDASVRAPQNGFVLASKEKGGVVLIIGGRPAVRYNAEVVESPQGIEKVYRRSGYIHPLYTPRGVAVTDDFPPDHAHQHALFFAWVNTSSGGKRVDFWNQKGGTGRIEHAELISTWRGPVAAGFSARIHHLDITADKPREVLQEVWSVRTYRVSAVTLVDLVSEQLCVTKEPLKINKYHYGGMALRGNRAWYGDGGKGTPPGQFLTSEGKQRKNGNHSRPRWVSLSGPTSSGKAGLVAMCHPGNFRSPQYVRLHPSKPYFCFSPMVERGFEIAPQVPYTSRYRLVAHDGPVDAQAIERLWRDYAEPPQVTIVAK